MSSPIAYPGSLMLGGPGNDIRVSERPRTQNIGVVFMGVLHGNNVPFHLGDDAWLTFMGKKK